MTEEELELQKLIEIKLKRNPLNMSRLELKEHFEDIKFIEETIMSLRAVTKDRAGYFSEILIEIKRKLKEEENIKKGNRRKNDI